MKTRLAGISALALLAIAGCSNSSDGIYTLYRTTGDSNYMRLHWATFDADQVGSERENMNLQLCQISAKYLQVELARQEPGSSVKFWCEKGRFRK
ncbi:MAG: hypothetical protein SF051_10210 [Elusimicrobiota bacterium]|nr:hypothetical protein [Elusimicrobiota bacterium]